VAGSPARDIAALGATFAGFVSHSRNPDLLATGLAAGVVFFGALIAMYVLHVAFRVTLVLSKFAIPAAAVLLLGCALDWPWAESAVSWLWAAGSESLTAVEHAWSTVGAR
jgi:hypothetical protein